MDTGQSFSKSELSVLWNRKSKRYTIKSFTENGHWITHLVLHDKCAGGTAIGKLVERSSEEFRQRPWLHHRNLASLIDMVTINDEFTVFISVYQEKCLREIVHDETFVRNSNCFTLKKIYTEDVLWGLDYLHRNGLCLMNLSDANVFICEQPNKAIITDFGFLSQINEKGECKFDVPFIHQPPEIRMGSSQSDLIASEMWIAGMMALEIFTQHKLPWALVDYNPDRALEMVAKVDYEILKVANAGSTLSIQDLCEFKTFVGLFIDNNPQRRRSARDSASATFLQSPKHNVSLKKLASNGEKNESISFPSIHRSPFNFKHNSRSNSSLQSLKVTRSQSDENKTGKSTSNLSFKKCGIPVKQVNSDLQSQSVQQPDFADFDNDAVSYSSNPFCQVNSESKSILNIDSVPQGKVINCFSDIEPLSKMESKISLSSQEEFIDCFSEKPANVSELNNDNATSVCSDDSLNEAIDVIPMHKPFAIRCIGHSPTIIREKADSTKMLSPETERIRKNIYDSYRNILNENKTDDSAHLENFSSEKVCVPCNIANCASSNNNLKYCLRKTSSDRSSTYRMIPNQKSWNDSTQSVIDDYNRKTKSMVGLKNSIQKSHIPVPKIFQETCRLDSKIEAKIARKTPYTLTKNNVSSFQKSVANNAPDLMPKKDNTILNELVTAYLKEIQQKSIRHAEEAEKQENRLVNNMQTSHISGFNHSNQSSVDAANFAMPTIPDVQTHIKNVTHCRFQHGYRCPKHQKAEMVSRLNKSINNDANFCKNTKEYAFKNKCKTCGNINIEPKVSDNNYENTLEFPPNGCPLLHEYWFPARTISNTKNSPILSPSPLSQISGKDAPEKDAKKAVGGSQRLSYTHAIWGGGNFQKNSNAVKNLEDVPKEENQSQKVVLVRGPIVKGRSMFRVEQVQTRHVKYMKKNAKKELKKCKKSARKGEMKNASTECMVVEGSSDEKKSSKKKSALKKCFCIGK